MQAVFGVSVLLSFLVSAVLSFRLLSLAVRTRELPETLAGLSFLIAGVIGFLLMVVGSGGAAGGMPPEMGLLFFQMGYWAISIGVVLTYGFTWVVFRRGSLAARAFAIAASLCVLATALPSASLAGAGSSLPTEAWPMFLFWLGHAVRVMCGVWGGFEAFRFHGLLVKRQRLGLSDPVVTNRVFLWGWVGAVAAAIFMVAMIGNVLQMRSPDEAIPMTQLQMSLVAILTLTAAGCQWFALVPPKSYLTWVRARWVQDA